VRRLAGGIAHDCTNLLTILLGYAEWLESRGGLDPRSAEAAREIHQASESAAVLVRQLLAFSRREPAPTELIELNQAGEKRTQDGEGTLARAMGSDNKPVSGSIRNTTSESES
jgi:signal transduction histidine kinase